MPFLKVILPQSQHCPHRARSSLRDTPLRMSVEAIKLGRFLFFEKALSDDQSISCGSCHIQERAFTDIGPTSVGTRGIFGRRKAMEIVLGLASSFLLGYGLIFWAIGFGLLHGELGMGTWTYYGGHDPEDYQHRVGDPKTELALYPNSPGYRLILNNILFPAAKKKPQKT